MDNLNEAVQAYLSYCSVEKRLSSGTIRAYNIDMKQFCTFMERTFPLTARPPEITRQMLQEYLAHLNKLVSVKTVKRKFACLRSFFCFLGQEEVIATNPFDKFHMKLKEPVVLPEVMTLREIKKILSAAYRSHTEPLPFLQAPVLEFLHYRDIAILEFLFATGLRVHELCNLTYKDYDAKKSTIKVFGKGQKERQVYIGNPEVLSALADYYKHLKIMRYKSSYIFLNKWGGKLSPQAVRNLVRKYTSEAGIKKNITPHAFRHTFATLLLEEGVDIKYIQEYLGHSSISTTQIYLHISAKSARNVLLNKHPRKKIRMVK